MIGQTLSHYRITAALGAGGMGEVYRATDTTLDREVAIKILPSEVSQDPERLARFRREARLLAALNHPNIAAIHGLEEVDGTPFLALELVPGEDLAERLSRGPVPVDEALEIGEQIAEALEEAHNKGIVHRDLKPANVKLTPDGRVKVLDFGLAKAWSGDEADGSSDASAVSQSPTLARTGTVAGVILGTAAYMSPEQARGKPVDRRADIWSFGVLLCELLTGRSLFAGDTVTDVIAAVVTKEPDLGALPGATPVLVRRLLSRCLRKDPRARLPDIGAARLELQDALAGSAEQGDLPQGATPEKIADETRSRARERGAWAAVTLALAAVAAALGFRHLREVPEPRTAVHFAVSAPDGWSFLPEFGLPIPSPDGHRVAFVARSRDPNADFSSQMIWLRSLESLAARPVVATEGARAGPYWSPDGRSFAFMAVDELRRLSLADGSVQRICTLPEGGMSTADWGTGGTILIGLGGNAGRIYAVADGGGEVRPLTTVDTERGELNHHFPRFLPDGRRFLFLVAGDATVAGTYVASLDAPDDKRPVSLGSWTRTVPDLGHLLSFRDGTVLAQPFDAERGQLAGEPTALVSSVAAWTANPTIGWYDSAGGTLSFLSGETARRQIQLAWVDRQGRDAGTLGAPGDYGQIALSPDGRNVALEIMGDDDTYDLWVMDVARGVTSRITARPGNERDPVWSPDSRELAFLAESQETNGTGGASSAALRRKGLRASDPETTLVDSKEAHIPESWSRDGRIFVVRRTADYDGQSIWAVPVEDQGEAVPIVEAGFFVDEPQLSPDRRYLAYVSRESGSDEVYVETLGRVGERIRASTDGGGQPKWRGDGGELFYATPEGRLMAVEVRSVGERLEVSLPVELFGIGAIEGTGYDDYAVTADGQRFLVKRPVEDASGPRLHIVANWPSLLD